MAFFSEHWHRVEGLRPRLRAHVPVRRHRIRGQSWYVIHDTASGQFHRFTPAAYLVIGSLDGRHTVAQIWQAAIDKLGDEAPTQADIVQLLSQLHAADLLRSDLAADAVSLFERHRSRVRRKYGSRVANPMSIRLPLVNPDRFLASTAGLVRPWFGWFGLIAWLIAIGYALALAAPRWSELTANLSDRLMGADNLLLMAAIFPVLKLLHELGHGYACKLRGGAVCELGLMILVLAPVPYVDASSSTAFRSRWDRVLVGAAGMLVETFVAALAMVVWVSVEPGLVRTIAFNVISIAGVSTIVFNINPLMRLDGYFILSDLIGIPNLSQRASRYWGDLAERRLLGATSEPMTLAPGERAWLVAYAPLSLVYRVIVAIGIALFVAQTLFFVGVVIALLSLATTLVWPLIKVGRHVLVSPRLADRRAYAVGITFGGALAVVLALLVIPVPLATVHEGVVWMPESAILRVAEDGFVDGLAARSGARVVPGERVLRAVDPALVVEAEVTQTQIEALNLRFESEQVTDRVRAELTRTEIALKMQTRANETARLARLDLKTDVPGTLVVPHEADLPGRFLKRGDIVGFVVPEQSRVVRLAVGQGDIDLVRQRPGRVEVRIAGVLAKRYDARLLREVPAGSTQLPSRALSIEGGGRIAVDNRDPKNVQALERQFLFDVELPVAAGASSFGARVFAKFHHGYEPIGFQAWRRLRQLLLSRLDY